MIGRQTTSSMDGKDRVGQDIVMRPAGKLTPASAAKVDGQVLRSAKNFSRARVPVDEVESPFFAGRGAEKFENDQSKRAGNKNAPRVSAEFEKSKKSLKGGQ